MELMQASMEVEGRKLSSNSVVEAFTSFLGTLLTSMGWKSWKHEDIHGTISSMEAGLLSGCSINKRVFSSMEVGGSFHDSRPKYQTIRETA